MDPFFIELEVLDESFTSTIKFIVLVETVPELAVEEASIVSVAGSCAPPPQGALAGAKRRRAHPPTRAGAAISRWGEGCRSCAPRGGGMTIFSVLQPLLPPILDMLFSASLDLDFYAGAGARRGG